MRKRGRKGRIISWAEWFDKRAGYYKNPLSKIAYYIDGKLLPYSVMRSTLDDVWKKLRADGCLILDVGGGVGFFAKCYQSKARRIVTIDMSAKMVKDGRRLNPKGDFLVCEALALPFASSSFDRLLCYSVFHYLEGASYVEKSLEEFIRVLRNKGLLLVGDVPFPAKAVKADKTSGGKAAKIKALYPACLKHDLKYSSFMPDFFKKFCSSRELECRILLQDIKGKPTSGSRYDVLIKVNK